jgi:hypothetical protein
VRPRLFVLVALGALACGGGSGSQAPAPQSLEQTLTRFMTAVKSNDLDGMKALWGSERGPASGYMDADYVRRSLTVFQIYLNHSGYRIVEGPLSVPGKDKLREFRVELQRSNGCSVVLPIDLVQARSGTWLVNDVHLEAAGNPAKACRS